MKYRSEIDGLRAIAVLPVIFFHAGFEYLSGGFVGVDIFFVISGYLITSIILSEKEQGTFSLANFYERRARRILPALFLVMLVSLPFAWLWLLPSDMKDFSQSLLAVSGFSSNILFWSESGYWGAVNELKPMLHTWSLAVEEQYYIVFPLFLMLMWKFRKRWIFSSFVIIAVFSLLIAQWGAYNKPTATFFLLPTRGWELAIGACIAFYFLYRKQNQRILLPNKVVDEVLGVIGLLMIAYSILKFDESTPFPSFYTLVPTIGTALIILFTSSETFVGRLLSSRLLVGIGLISYSIYLWHQPILAFTRHASFAEAPSVMLLSAVVTLSIPLAYLSWRYIEKPFRTKGVFSRKDIFKYSLAGTTIFIAIGLSGVITNGFENRSTSSQLTFQSIEEKWKANTGLSENCTEEFTLSTDCRTSDNPEIIIWGDSYAMHLINGVLASKPDAKIIQMTKYTCGPFFDIAPINEPNYPKSWAQGCLNFNSKVLDYLETNNSIKYAVLSSPFSYYLSPKGIVLNRNGEITTAEVNLVAQEFENTLKTLEKMGIKPIIFSPPPANGENLARCLTRADWSGSNLNSCDFSKDEMSDDRKNVYEFLERFETKHRVVRLDDYICDGDNCKTHIGATYIYRDEGHLSYEGSAVLGEKYNFYKSITDVKTAELVPISIDSKPISQTTIQKSSSNIKLSKDSLAR